MDGQDLGQHISHSFDAELEQLRSRVMAMAGLVEEQLRKALDAITNGDSQLGEAVAHDDYKVNNMEVAIDEECSRILARRQPAASDLRLVVAVIKTIADLERIGDEAEKIGFLASRLASVERPKGAYRELRNLGRHVQLMTHKALDTFARLDADAALEVARSDARVDEEYEALLRQSITFMMEDPRTIGRILDATWAARSLERIADHAKNICEYVVYMVHGKDIRHISAEDVDRELGKQP